MQNLRTTNDINKVSVTNAVSGSKHIDARAVGDDNQLLALIGYKQELRRYYTPVQVFGVAFSIMGLLPSIASTFNTGLTTGPVGLVWGWFIAGFFILLIGVSMAEMASAIPTSGGLYFWTYHYAPTSFKAPLSFLVGFSNSMALAASVCSIDYGLAQQILSAVTVGTDGKFVPTNAQTYAVFAASVILMTILTSFASSAISKLQTVSIVANCALMVLFFIALPVGVARSKTMTHSFNNAKFIFGNFQNFSDWNNGWSFSLFGLNPAIWTISAFDSCVHMSEEAKDATRSVPIGIIGSIAACWILGFCIMIVLAACMDPDVSKVYNSIYSEAITQIFYDVLGKRWAVTFLVLISCCQFLMGASTLVAISRQIWAFARDDGLPFSGFMKVVNKRLSVPLRATWVGGLFSVALGLLCLAGDQASNALFALSVAGMYLAFAVPNLLRLTYARKEFTPGAFYLGNFWSPVVNWLSFFFQLYATILLMFPLQKNGITGTTMNYTVVIGPGLWIVTMIWYYLWQKKDYIGPKSNLSDDESVDVSTISEEFKEKC